MGEAQRNWNSLPVEILLQILRQIVPEHLNPNGFPQFNNLNEIALVCKAWGIPAQSILYSNVNIKSPLQFRNFYRTISQNEFFGKKVKRFALQNSYNWPGSNPKETDFLECMTNLLCTCLPNLEELEEKVVNSYLPVLTALLDSELKHLKRLSKPSYGLDQNEVENYITCALLMKDRIEKVAFPEYTSNTKPNHFERLYNKLHQFDKLVELQITGKTADGIQMLERVLKSSHFLKRLQFEFSSPQFEYLGQTTSMDEISKYIPSNNIETLNATIVVSDDYKMLLYLIHKFPSLNTLTLHHTSCEDFPVRLNGDAFSRLLKYLSGIKTFSVTDLRISDDNISKTIGNYWKSKPEPGGECLELIYTIFDDHEDGPFVHDIVYEISKPKDRSESTITFLCSLGDLEQEYIDILKRNGKYIGELRFDFTVVAETEYDLEVSEDLLIHVFKYCPNLRILRFTKCVFDDRLSASRIGLDKKVEIDQLYFTECTLSPCILDQLSMLLSEVKELHISNNEYNTDEDFSPELETLVDKAKDQIIMPHTNIGSISIDEGHSYLKVFAINNGDYQYYRLDGNIEVSNEREYAEADE